MTTTEAGRPTAPKWDFVGHFVGRDTVIPDWGALGQYQLVADGLAQIAQAVIEAARIQKGEAVLDVGSRCGNWALLAAQAGAKLTGIDFSPGLLEQARAKLQDYPDARFELADVARMPFADSSFDVVMDVMTLIFGDDPEKAVAEMARVLKPDGRIVWSGWFGGDAVADAAKIQMQDTAAAVGHAAFPYSWWGSEDDMRKLFGARGFEIEMTKHLMVSTAPSAQFLLERIDQVHPVSRACSLALEKAGVLEQTMAKMADALERRNEGAEGLTISRYFVVGVATRKH